MILLIDDETRRFHSHRMELEECLTVHGLEVRVKRDTDDAYQFFNANKAAIRLIILDIMMSPGEVFSRHSTESGLRTGMVFFEYIRGQRPDLPVIVFSNVSDPEVGKTFAAKENCRFLQKIDVAPLDLVEEVCEMLGLKPGN